MADLSTRKESFLITGLNAKSTGTTTVCAARSGKTFIPTAVFIRRSAYSGTPSSFTFSLGVTSTNYNDIMDTRTFSGGVVLNEVKRFDPDSAVDSAGLAVSMANALTFKIVSASTATTDTVDIVVEGYVV